jgi:tetratricopeptide (TPR) repeat protein
MVSFLAWVEVNKLRLIKAGAAVGVVWLGVYAYGYYRERHEQDANAALFAAVRLPEAGTKHATTPAADLLKVVEQFPGTRAAERASFLAAAALFDDRKYPQAKEQFEKFLVAHAGSPLSLTASLGVAACLDAIGDSEKALNAYQQLIANNPGSPEAAQARLAIAVLHESRNRPAEALKLYEEIIRVKPPSVWEREAQERRQLLFEKHPELMPKPQPVVITNLPAFMKSNAPALPGSNRPVTITPNPPKAVQKKITLTNLPPSAPPPTTTPK